MRKTFGWTVSLAHNVPGHQPGHIPTAFNQSPLLRTADNSPLGRGKGSLRFSNRYTVQLLIRCKMRSKTWWLTDSCKSHYFSHFTAFFIVARAKRSIVKSCQFVYSHNSVKQTSVNVVTNDLWGSLDCSVDPPHTRACALGCLCVLVAAFRLYCTQRFVNDPSAGSPTETLLRLLLPLNDKIWTNSDKQWIGIL